MPVLKNYFIISVLLSFSFSIHGKPADWKVTFGVDSTGISNYARTKINPATVVSDASQEFALDSQGGLEDAFYQSYILTLSPTFLINDSATIKAELTTGYGRGGILGEGTTRAKDKTRYGNALYNYTTNSSEIGLSVSQMYLELYSDTATYLIGRHSAHWGLGAVVNSGEQLWDRHLSIRNGITMKVKLGNFNFAPFWGKMASSQSLTSAQNATEWGVASLYDNNEKDLQFGVYYSNRKSESHEATIQSQMKGGASAPLYAANVSLIDIYFKKSFHNFNFALEAPFASGELGSVYNTSSSTKYNATALIFQSDYELNKIWTFGLDVGLVSGDSGSSTTFQAMYLHPNFNVGHLLFNYNPEGISQTSMSVFDAYVSNTRYAKIRSHFRSEKWTWNSAIIYALADKTASKGQAAFNHEKNKHIASANFDQKNDYGLEFDLDFKYHWNNEISIGGTFAYLVTGNYFAFTDQATENETINPTLLKIDVICSF